MVVVLGRMKSDDSAEGAIYRKRTDDSIPILYIIHHYISSQAYVPKHVAVSFFLGNFSRQGPFAVM